ncbi:hypothetical protein DCCM_4165 [Desulfocucumis palustris]|uniref:Beta-lactamase n=1 Tax=Desulfocucumis palustris TaxID=1898651 RepID=A0A2L2XGC0_9FIRM|nr:serine hydrolase [Desulfocucumis palustris]GBF35044.1 hypothetical protein DCCM_4165 [Desulfocucumis palustris]
MIRLLITFVMVVLLITTTGAEARGADLSSSDMEYQGLQNRLEQMLGREKGTYGVLVMDIQSGRVCALNPLEPFHAASTFKLPMNIYLFKKIASGETDPGQKLVYRESHYEGGTGKLQYNSPGTSYTIETLSQYSIIYSDNVATNVLLSFLGKKNVKDFMRQSGGLVVDDSKNLTCPRDMALYMRELLEFAGQSPEQANRLIDYLENTVFNERIPALLPKSVKIAHKIGNWPATATYNDVGYVRHPVNPYIISIFSKNTPGAGRAYDVISRISKAVYDYQNDFFVVSLLFNGTPLESDVPPFMESGRVFVPARVVAEALDAKVTWDGENWTVGITGNGKNIILQVDNPEARVNEASIEINPPARLINGRTMVPLRFVAENLGAEVLWDDPAHTVNIIPGTAADEQENQSAQQSPNS